MANRKLTLSLAIPATASATTIGAAVPGFGKYQALKCEFAAQGLTGGTLDVYIQHSFDGGVTFYDCVHFAQFAGGAAATTLDFCSPPMDATIRAVGTGTAGAATPALAINTIVPGPWGDVMRLVSVSGAGVSAGAYTATVQILCWDGLGVNGVS